MKTIALLLFAVFSMVVATAQSGRENPLNANTPFEITGKVLHYQPNDNNGFITFRTYTITGKLKDTAIKVGMNGNFHVQLWQPHEGDIALMYDNEYITLYVTPGEKVTLQIDRDSWKQAGNKLQSITITGKSASISKSIIDFNHYKATEGSLKQTPFKNITDEDYAKARTLQMKKELAILEDYVKIKNLQNSVFQNWCENDIRYNAGWYITYHCFAGKVNRTITPDQLIDLLKAAPVNNLDALHNSNYYRYLSQLAGDMEIIVNLNATFRDAIREQGNNRLPVYLAQIDHCAKGFARQLMYYDIYSFVHPKNAPYPIEKFTNIITDPVLLQFLMQRKERLGKSFQPYALIQRIKAYKVNDTLKQRLIHIFEDQKGHYVYIDFWGIWCGPCMAEMPTYTKLTNQDKNKSTHFIFFAVETSEEKAKEVKNKYNIQGKFITLSNNEVKILNNVMHFSWVPYHVILDTTGTVVAKRAGNVWMVKKQNDRDANILKGLLGKKGK